MIKCERVGREMTIEADGTVQQVAADCCEVISAIYRKVPSPARELFKACVLMAVTHEESPMWRLDRREDSVAFCSSKGELERQMAELQRKWRSEGGSSVTRVDLTKEQCSELASYLRGILNGGMGAGCFGKIEMLVTAYRAGVCRGSIGDVCASDTPPLNRQNPLLHGAVRQRLRSSSARRWRGWRLIAGQTASPALRLWRSCVTRWTAKLSPRRCWAECWAGRGFR